MKYGVVVAEDEILIQQNIIKKIEACEAGFTVVGKAQTGIQALELIREHNPYLLVTDIRMPVMNGLELIERAKELQPDLDTIVVSGYSDFEYAQQAIHLQVKEYLLKPVDPDKLKEILQSLAAQYHVKKKEVGETFSSDLSSRSPSEIAELLMDYLTREYARELNLNLIAENLNYSPSYLTKIFQQYYHVPPTKYLINLRMQKAKEMMEKSPDTPLHLIGEAVGYSDPAYFSRVFKKYEGVSPQKFRDNQ